MVYLYLEGRVAKLLKSHISSVLHMMVWKLISMQLHCRSCLMNSLNPFILFWYTGLASPACWYWQSYMLLLCFRCLISVGSGILCFAFCWVLSFCCLFPACWGWKGDNLIFVVPVPSEISKALYITSCGILRAPLLFNIYIYISGMVKNSGKLKNLHSVRCL